MLIIHYQVKTLYMHVFYQIFKRGFDPLLLCFMNEIKIVSFSFSSSAIEYNSNKK